MLSWPSTAFGFSAGVGIALVAVTLPRVQQLVVSDLSSVITPLVARISGTSRHEAVLDDTFLCQPQNYTTQIVSLDPLVVYIHDFLNPSEIDNILAASEPLLKPSTVTKYGVTVQSEYRTSWSAEIPRENLAVQCVEERIWTFMGTLMVRGKDAVEPPQIVRYSEGQKFDMHHDWYERPQADSRGKRRGWNRVASFFAILQDNCTGGETYFPNIKPVTPIPDGWAHRVDAPWREHEDGGLAFRPIKGNSLFWVNLHMSGEGDMRVEHAGLPVKQGIKTAMNIWPREYIGPDAWDIPTELTS